MIEQYYEQFNAHKFDNLDKIDQFLIKTKPDKTHTKIKNNLNRFISIKAVESIINHLPPKMLQVQMRLLVNLPNI